MTEQTKDSYVVVAREGYQVLLNVRGECLTIDAFTPVNLSEMYSEETLRNCGSLSSHLREGNLVFYDGQVLPKDPNVKRIKALRKANAQHIKVSYTQEARDDNHPNMQLETTLNNVEDSGEKSIQERITESRQKEEETTKRMEKRVRADISRGYDVSASVETDPGKETNATIKNMKVSMDVDPREFADKQLKAREKINRDIKSAEENARKQIEKIDGSKGNVSDTTGE